MDLLSKVSGVISFIYNNFLIEVFIKNREKISKKTNVCR